MASIGRLKLFGSLLDLLPAAEEQCESTQAEKSG
jgi:hypothetical protein